MPTPLGHTYTPRAHQYFHSSGKHVTGHVTSHVTSHVMQSSLCCYLSSGTGSHRVTQPPSIFRLPALTSLQTVSLPKLHSTAYTHSTAQPTCTPQHSLHAIHSTAYMHSTAQPTCTPQVVGHMSHGCAVCKLWWPSKGSHSPTSLGHHTARDYCVHWCLLLASWQHVLGLAAPLEWSASVHHNILCKCPKQPVMGMPWRSVWSGVPIAQRDRSPLCVCMCWLSWRP